jgi:hypothetical protein
MYNNAVNKSPLVIIVGSNNRCSFHWKPVSLQVVDGWNYYVKYTLAFICMHHAVTY